MQLTRLLCKITDLLSSKNGTSSLQYYSRYVKPRTLTLSKYFDSVNEENRFISLQILLKRLSGHVGRRQHKINCDVSVHFDKLKQLGIDWHDLKSMSREDLIELMNKELCLSHAAKATLLTAIEAKICGVLKKSTRRHSTNLCMRSGSRENGWRCGYFGHTNDVFFEDKAKANPAVLQLARHKALAVGTQDGVDVEVRRQPDFSVVGRQAVQSNPRVWSSPENPSFIITFLGYEFRVHPDDPRAAPQIEKAAAEWELHASVVQHVLSEVLEMHAVERTAQKLTLSPGEMGPPDVPQTYSSYFVAADGSRGGPVIEQRMISTDGKELPWFRTPLEQVYEDGVPLLLPVAPSIVIHSSFRHTERDTGSKYDARLMQPLVDVSCFIHPDVCFWFNASDEASCVQQVLDYTKRMPFALPFNMYFRVDSTKHVRAHPEFVEEVEKQIARKSEWFDLRNFALSTSYDKSAGTSAPMS
ncbi:hypothetical protein STCU_00294 [Strigomonas culicis]|uniref:Uncharacterized protein n=1 Tax=Strigomonas culicis TaxID=28005 RepID=S9W4M7_9TRYP|nr:hypothetical protein STCU_03871 [Strigomonas culicis]EPY31823.1 hypothetical protein STCU_03202 [Strigomonas culicis]EPY37004.1 hypothetical protein STCU_00294 [Strigomonas culicis]|eukprot:EPY30830.1 hypothetical protein STCU_03871 [Strigomonas culicis]